jgi:hypothetical protein
MRYNDRVTLIYLTGPVDELTGEVSKRIVDDVPSTIIPITDFQELATYGLLKTTAYEVHLKNIVDTPNRLLIDGIEYSIVTSYRHRKVTVMVCGK